MGTVELGYTEGTSNRRGRTGANIEAHFGGGGGEAVIFGGGASARIRLANSTQQFGIGGHAYMLAPTEVAHIFLRGGLHLLQFEHLDGDFAFGSGSPFASIGVIFPGFFSDDFAGPLTFSVSFNYDVRVTEQPSEGFWGISLGIGASIVEPSF
jgi:hypothetical protein